MASSSCWQLPGQVACVSLWPRRAWTAAASRERSGWKTHAFPGHIVRDSASNSELVVPVIREGRLLGVLDLDSPRHGAPRSGDQAGIEACCSSSWEGTDFPVPRTSTLLHPSILRPPTPPTPSTTCGVGGDGWHLLADPALPSVIQERVPQAPGEQAHRHHVRGPAVLLYILAGEAAITVEGREVPLKAGQGLHVPAGVAHRFHNPSTVPVDFLVVSSPTTRGDRENLPT